MAPETQHTENQHCQGPFTSDTCKTPFPDPMPAYVYSVYVSYTCEGRGQHLLVLLMSTLFWGQGLALLLTQPLTTWDRRAGGEPWGILLPPSQFWG